MGNWLHLLYDSQKGILWRNILPVAVLVIVFGFLYGVVVGVGGLSVSAILKSASWKQNQTTIIETQAPKAAPSQHPPLGQAPKVSPTEEEKSQAVAQRIAIGEWVQGRWSTSAFDAYANIIARVSSADYFTLLNNPSRAEIRPEGIGKVLYVDGKRMSDAFDDIQYIRAGSNRGADIVAVNVRRGAQWTVAVNGRPWDRWFDGLFQYAVINKGVAIGVKIGTKWTIAVNGIPWSQRFDAILNYNIFPNGSVVAEVQENGRTFVVLDGREDSRLPPPRFVSIGEQGKIAWYRQVSGEAVVTVDYVYAWRSKFPAIDGLVVSNFGRVVAGARSNERVTAVIDDVPWPHWYESRAVRFGWCSSSVYLGVEKNGLSTLAVNDKVWSSWFDELGPIGCEKSGAVSAGVKKNGKSSVVRNGSVVSGWYADLRGWVVNKDGTLLAAAVADTGQNGKLDWRVEILPLN